MSEQRDGRRRVVGALASSVRALADAAAETAADEAEVAAVTVDVHALAERLAAERHDGPYSGLHGRELDLSTPAGPLPLSPVIGDCNPSAPEVHLRFEDGRVRGRGADPSPRGPARCRPRWGGGDDRRPARGRDPVPARPHVCHPHDDRPLPPPHPAGARVGTRSVVRAGGGRRGPRAWCTISADGEVVLDAEADMVVAMHVTRPERRP